MNASIAAALQGQFGDVQFTTRTRHSELFINPLMAMYFAVDLDGLARRSPRSRRQDDNALHYT